MRWFVYDLGGEWCCQGILGKNLSKVVLVPIKASLKQSHTSKAPILVKNNYIV